MPGSLETALFARLIDHAPLFPPARLPLPEALAEHRAAVAGPYGWIVASLRLPGVDAGRAGRASRLRSRSSWTPTPTSTIHGSSRSRFRPTEPVRLCGRRPMPRWRRTKSHEPRSCERGVRAKLRCGPQVPAVDELAGAIRLCRQHAVPFKATAGLHHAVRQEGQHGFLNLLAAAIFADEEGGARRGRPRSVPPGRQTSSVGATGERRLREVEEGRELFVAFGSCSFSEPIDDLRALGLLTT